MGLRLTYVCQLSDGIAFHIYVILPQLLFYLLHTLGDVLCLEVVQNGYYRKQKMGICFIRSRPK